VPRRILLVDDDITEISAVKRVLLRAGHQPVLATTSSDALAAIARALPELVVLAPDCEEGEGAALARRLVADESTRAIPLVLLANSDLPGIRARLVQRPIDPATLDEEVRAALAGGATPKPSATATATPTPSVSSPSPWKASGGRGKESPTSWFDTAEVAPEPEPLEGSAFDADALREIDDALSELNRELEEDDTQLAEAACAAEEALADARRADEERRTAEAAARRESEQVEAERAAVADAARRRVLAVAKERTAAAAIARSASAQRGAGALPREVAEGSLSATSMPRLLALAARARATGRLEVASEPPRSLWLEDGRVVGAASGADAERTEEVALRLGLVTREQHRQAAPAAAGLASRRVGVLLLERGFLKPTELAFLARRRAEEIAFALFASGAPYRFLAGERVPADERLGLDRGTLALAVEGVRRRWEAARLDAVLGGAGTLLAPSARAPPEAELALSTEESRVVELADGLRTLDEIVAGGPLDPLSSRQTLAALVEVGALEVKILAPAGAPAPGSGSIDLARVDEKLDQVRRADYFAILGLGRAATAYEIREASGRLLSDLAPERFDGVPAEGLVAKLDEIRQVISEARDILADDALRAEYLAGLGE